MTVTTVSWAEGLTTTAAIVALVIAVISLIVTIRLTKRAWKESLSTAQRQERLAAHLAVKERARSELSLSLAKWAGWFISAAAFAGLIRFLAEVRAGMEMAGEEFCRELDMPLQEAQRMQSELSSLGECASLLVDYTPVFEFSWQLCARFQLAEGAASMYWSAMRDDLEAHRRSGEADQDFVARFVKAEAEFQEYYQAFTDLRSWVQISTFAEHGDDPARSMQALSSAKRIFRPGGEWGDLWAVRGLKLELMDIYRPAPTPGEPGPVEPGERDIGPPT